MWWPVWMGITVSLWVAAWAFGAKRQAAALAAILAALVASRLAAPIDLQWLWMMAIWVVVALFLLQSGLYAAAGFAAVSSAAYFQLWTTFFLADLAGLAMLACLGHGITVDAATSDRMAKAGNRDWSRIR